MRTLNAITDPGGSPVEHQMVQQMLKMCNLCQLTICIQFSIEFIVLQVNSSRFVVVDSFHKSSLMVTDSSSYRTGHKPIF